MIDLLHIEIYQSNECGNHETQGDKNFHVI